MSDTLTRTTELVTIICGKCGILFAMPEKFEESRRNDHATFYCPSGHSRYFPGKSEEEKLKRQLQQERARADRAEEDAEHQRKYGNVAMRRLRAQKGVTTKLKKRVANGVCPCCNRTFVNLGRHMSSKHPSYVEDS